MFIAGPRRVLSVASGSCLSAARQNVPPAGDIPGRAAVSRCPRTARRLDLCHASLRAAVVRLASRVSALEWEKATLAFAAETFGALAERLNQALRAIRETPRV